MSRVASVVVAVALLTACTPPGGLGVGLPECEAMPRQPTNAMLLSLQAVPSSEFAPCIDDIQLGWDMVEFAVESGRAEVVITAGVSPFLTVTLTPTCDFEGARQVPSGHPEIDRYIDIETEVGPTVSVVLIPTGQRGLARAAAMATAFTDLELEDRLVEFVVDDDIHLDVRERTFRASRQADYVWLIDTIDAAEGTVQVRDAQGTEIARGVSPDEALEEMESIIAEPAYRGVWYDTFVGGCITYTFAAAGRVAATIEEDVESSMGVYDLDALRALGRRRGIDLEQAPPPGT